MWPHFANLFGRIVHGMPVLVSSNWAASILGLAAFALTELLLFIRTERGQRMSKLFNNVLIGVVVTTFVYAILFVWSSVQTVYDDHHDASGRWKEVVNEKNKLKTILQQRDDYIRTLEQQSSQFRLPKGTADGTVPKRGVQNDETPLPLGEGIRVTQEPLVPSPMEGLFALKVVVQAQTKVPNIKILFECNGEVESVKVKFDFAGVYGDASRVDSAQKKYFVASVYSSPLSPETPILITVFSKTRIKVVKATRILQ